MRPNCKILLTYESLIIPDEYRLYSMGEKWEPCENMKEQFVMSYLVIKLLNTTKISTQQLSAS